MKFENSWTGNWENAFRGLRHPLESYARSDSDFGIGDCDAWLESCRNEVAYSYCSEGHEDKNWEETDEWLAKNGELRFGKHAGEYAYIGKNDLDLAQRMIKAGSPNDKFLRQIFVSVDITAPLYWWKEMDTYKVGTTANSTSTMHKLASTPITIDCFETDDYDPTFVLEEGQEVQRMTTFEDEPISWGVNSIIHFCERLRQKYLETKDKRYWKELIRWLPEGWKQTRTWTADYAVLRNIIHWRQGHKLTEWHQFVDWCRTLPYANELLFYENEIFDNK
jgi:hypothetical protein